MIKRKCCLNCETTHPDFAIICEECGDKLEWVVGQWESEFRSALKFVVDNKNYDLVANKLRSLRSTLTRNKCPGCGKFMQFKLNVDIGDIVSWEGECCGQKWRLWPLMIKMVTEE